MNESITIVGHVCCDVAKKGQYAPGGTALYASVTAQRLGASARLVTSFGQDYPFTDSLPKKTVVVPAEHNTVFENTYKNGGRRSQRVHSCASRITARHIPTSWNNSTMVLIGPIAGEIDVDVIEAFSPDALMCVCPQGWMRTWDAEGYVSRRDFSSFNWDCLRRADIVILSEEDIGRHEDSITDTINADNITILTRAERGSTVFLSGGERHDIAAFPANVVDECGAGDVFATAFLLQYQRTRDWRQAAHFASAVAACSVEGLSISAIPTLSAVKSRSEFFHGQSQL